MKYKIIYAGSLSEGETSLYRFRSLQRLQQNVIPFNCAQYKFSWSKVNSVARRLPIGPLIAKINRDLSDLVQREKPDIVWFDKPAKFTVNTIRCIKALGVQTVNYNQDNPFGPRKDGGWYQYLKIYKMLDLHCLVRDVDVERYSKWGLQYIKTQFSFDPQENFPPPSDWTCDEGARDISYIGSPYEERPQFLRSLLKDYKLPLVISGPRWEQFFNKYEFEKYTQGGMLRGAEYRENIWKSKVNLAFVTHSNEDDVAHKAFEIAACKGFLLALRCPGHQACFVEGKEADFFSTVAECAEKARYYLEHPVERREIAQRGYERAIRSGYDNDTQLSHILESLDKIRINT